MKSRFSKTLAALTGLIVLGGALACRQVQRPLTQEQKVARGRYLVSVIGCSDCHTPMKMGEKGPEPDMSMFLAGHPEKVGKLPRSKAQGPWLWAGSASNTAFSGPWGTTYAINLTPDKQTGMGVWTEDLFIKAMREGKHFGTSRPIMPPMPWQDFRNMTDEDLSAVFAYLQSVPPVVNKVPDYEPPAGS